MPQTTIPGIAAKHVYITDTCRANRTDKGAIEEALERIRAEAEACMPGNKPGAGIRFHIVLTVERPDSQTARGEDPELVVHEFTDADRAVAAYSQIGDL